MGWLWWLAGALLLLVVEVLTLDLVLLMFAGGALAAVVANLLGGDLIVQIVAFAVVSTVLLFALRPWMLRHLRARTALVETNVAAHVGRTATVVTEVGDTHGRVKLVGEVWTARPAVPGQVFAVDTVVRVERIDGATAVVGPLTADQGGPDEPGQAGPASSGDPAHPPAR